MADRFFVDGLVDNNWGSTLNWSTSSGGAGGASVPTASDAVFLDANSPNCILDASTRSALSINFTGYTNTITFDQVLQVHGNITLAAAMSFAGSAALVIMAACTFTSNGQSVDVPLQVGTNTGGSGGSFTVTLADDLTTTSTLTIAVSSNNTKTFNGNTWHLRGNLVVGGASSSTSTQITAGTTVFLVDGTCTWTAPAACYFGNSLTINTAGTFTVSGTVYYRTGTLTYTAGTVVTTGSHILVNVTGTFNCAGITWNHFTFSAASTPTLAADLVVAGNLEFIGTFGSTHTISGAFSIFVGGSLTLSGSSNPLVQSTDTTIVLNGTGTWSHTSSQRLAVALTFNTAGTITISGTVRYSTRTMTHTSGTVVAASPGSGILVPSSAATIFNFNGGTLDADLTISGGGTTVSLASGLTIATGRTFTLLGASSASRASLQSTSGGTQRAFILTAGALTNIKFFNSTDMDSSGGQTVIWRPPGTLSNTINWGGAGGGAHGGGRGGGGDTQFRPTGANFVIVGNPGVTVVVN